MRTIKLSVAAATTLAAMSIVGISFADVTAAAAGPVTTPTSQTTTPTSQTTTPMSQTTTTTGPVPTSTSTVTSADTTMSATPRTVDSTTLYDSRRPNRPLLITGGAILIGSYVTTAAVAGSEGSTRDNDLYIPVVGPWINLSTRGTDQPSSTRDTLLIGASGLLQAAGAGLTIASFLVPEKVATATIAAGPVRMQVTPTASAGAGGVGAFGTF